MLPVQSATLTLPSIMLILRPITQPLPPNMLLLLTMVLILLPTELTLPSIMLILQPITQPLLPNMLLLLAMVLILLPAELTLPLIYINKV